MKKLYLLTIAFVLVLSTFALVPKSVSAQAVGAACAPEGFQECVELSNGCKHRTCTGGTWPTDPANLYVVFQDPVGGGSYNCNTNPNPGGGERCFYVKNGPSLLPAFLESKINKELFNLLRP